MNMPHWVKSLNTLSLVDSCCLYLGIPPDVTMGLVRITSRYPKFNGSHFGLPPSEIHRMTGLPPKIV